MDCTLVKDLYRDTEKYLEKDVQVAGWVRTVRNSKAFGFIEMNDGTFFNNVQIVFDDKLANFNDVCKLTISSSIVVNGTVVKMIMLSNLLRFMQKVLKYINYLIRTTLFKRKAQVLNF